MVATALDQTRTVVTNEITVAKPDGIKLTPDQQTALEEIIEASRSIWANRKYLLTGYAGSGKTTLMQEVAREFLKQKKKVALSAPTHKAVSVLRAKIMEANIPGEIVCTTIHSLLSLQPVPDGAKTKLKRRKNARHIEFDIVIIDECSMVDADLMENIMRYLGHVFVLFVGDPAQLPPVGEKESITFTTPKKSHLNTIMRQAADNPILQAAHIIRSSQGGALDMSWCKSATAKPFGVYLPRKHVDEWLKKAFTSEEFAEDNDTFRYLCWTNKRVSEINSKIRNWIYGKTETPFSVGESVMMRAPIFGPYDDEHPLNDRPILFNTNDEALIVEIGESFINKKFPFHGEVDAWEVSIPVWHIALRHFEFGKVWCRIPKKQEDIDEVNSQLVFEAKTEGARWVERHEFMMDVAKLQSVFALTVHTSQGSTFKNVFCDVGDIVRRSKTNLLECQQMLYVAATRPSHALMLVNV